MFLHLLLSQRGFFGSSGSLNFIFPKAMRGGILTLAIKARGHSTTEDFMFMSSVFTQIVRGEIPSHRVAEDEHFLAFLDIQPIRPGHTLVIPKEEVDHFFDMDDRLLSRALLFAKPIGRAIQAVTGADRVGAVVAGFDVPHAHLHLIPADTMADLDFSRAKRASHNELARMAEQLRKVLVDY